MVNRRFKKRCDKSISSKQNFRQIKCFAIISSWSICVKQAKCTLTGLVFTFEGGDGNDQSRHPNPYYQILVHTFSYGFQMTRRDHWAYACRICHHDVLPFPEGTVSQYWDIWVVSELLQKAILCPLQGRKMKNNFTHKSVYHEQE